MDLFEYENSIFGDLWDEEAIEHLRKSQSPKRVETDFNYPDEHDEELYREYQEANWEEYSDWAQTYRYCLYK